MKIPLNSSKWFKPAMIVAGVLLVLLLALFSIPVLIDINTYRGQITGQVEQTLGRTVKLGKMGISVLPSIKVDVDELQIGDDPQFAPGDFVKARSVRLQIGLWSLLRGHPQMQGIELVEPSIVLIRNQGDRWNWGTLKPLQSSEGDASSSPFDLVVRDGRFTVSDHSTDPPTEKSYTGVNVALDDFSPRRAFGFVIGLTMPGEKGGKLILEGDAGPISPISMISGEGKTNAMRPPPFQIDARLRMEGVELAALETLFGVASPHAGRLTMDVKINGNLAEGLKAAGDLKAEQLRLVENVEPARTPLETEFTLTAKSEQGAAEQATFSLAIDRCQVRMGKTKAEIAGLIHRIPAQPTLDLQVKGDGVALDNLIESAYAFGFGPPPGTKASGSATIALRASGEARAIALNGKIGIRDLKFQSSTMPQPVTVSELDLDCNPDRIAAAPFRAALSRTTVELSNFGITSYTQEPRAHLDVATSNAQLDDLIRIAESFGARTGVAASSGTASLRASIATNLNAAARGMTISGEGKLTKARLQMSQAAKPVEVANGDLSFTGDSLRIANLAAQSGASQVSGWLQIKDFDQPLVNFDLKSSQIHLPELQQLMASGPAQAKSSGANSMRADGQIAIGKLVMDTLTATDVQAKLTMANRLLTLAPMSLKMYGGVYQGAVTVDTSSGASSDIALRGNFNGLDINQFLSASGQKSSIYGRANGSIDVRGRSDNSQEAMAKSLVGNGAIAISDGQFASFDLMKQVEVLGKSFNLPTGGAGTAFRSLKTNLVFERGRMRTDTLQIVMDDLQVSGNGAIQLGEAPSVAYELLARLSPELTKRVLPPSSAGAGKILSGIEKLSSALGNFFIEQNAMVIPIKMSGPIKQPSFGLNSAVLEKQAKSRLTERLVEGLSKDSGKDAAKETGKEQAKPKPEDLLKGVLEGLGRKKKKPPE